MSARNLAKSASNITDTGSPRQSAFPRSSVSHSVTNYDSYGSLPREGLIAGQQAFTLADNTLFITDGNLWFRTAVVNRAPYITSITDDSANSSPFTLSNIGEVTTITIVAGDSDAWQSITFSAAPDSDFNTMATISQNENIFTITPLSQDSATATSGNVTFSVTDGQNVTSSLNEFNLVFVPEPDYTNLNTGSTAASNFTSVASATPYVGATTLISTFNNTNDTCASIWMTHEYQINFSKFNVGTHTSGNNTPRFQVVYCPVEQGIAGLFTGTASSVRSDGVNRGYNANSFYAWDVGQSYTVPPYQFFAIVITQGPFYVGWRNTGGTNRTYQLQGNDWLTSIGRGLYTQHNNGNDGIIDFTPQMGGTSSSTFSNYAPQVSPWDFF